MPKEGLQIALLETSTDIHYLHPLISFYKFQQTVNLLKSLNPINILLVPLRSLLILDWSSWAGVLVERYSDAWPLSPSESFSLAPSPNTVSHSARKDFAPTQIHSNSGSPSDSGRCSVHCTARPRERSSAPSPMSLCSQCTRGFL